MVLRTVSVAGLGLMISSTHTWEAFRSSPARSTTRAWTSSAQSASSGSVAPKRAPSRTALVIEFFRLSETPPVMVPNSSANNKGAMRANSTSAAPPSPRPRRPYRFVVLFMNVALPYRRPPGSASPRSSPERQHAPHLTTRRAVMSGQNCPFSHAGARARAPALATQREAPRGGSSADHSISLMRRASAPLLGWPPPRPSSTTTASPRK